MHIDPQKMTEEKNPTHETVQQTYGAYEETIEFEEPRVQSGTKTTQHEQIQVEDIMQQ
jgi:hypothetical protein